MNLKMGIFIVLTLFTNKRTNTALCLFPRKSMQKSISEYYRLKHKPATESLVNVLILLFSNVLKQSIKKIFKIFTTGYQYWCTYYITLKNISACRSGSRIFFGGHQYLDGLPTPYFNGFLKNHVKLKKFWSVWTLQAPPPPPICH